MLAVKFCQALLGNTEGIQEVEATIFLPLPIFLFPLIIIIIVAIIS